MVSQRQHSGHHQARHPSSRSSRWGEAHLGAHLYALKACTCALFPRADCARSTLSASDEETRGVLKVFLENGAIACNNMCMCLRRQMIACVPPPCRSHPRRRLLHGARAPQNRHGERATCHPPRPITLSRDSWMLRAGHGCRVRPPSPGAHPLRLWRLRMRSCVHRVRVGDWPRFSGATSKR